MSIVTEISRLKSAKSAIAAAIAGKGVTVPDGTMLDGMADLIAGIEAGGGDVIVKAFETQPLKNEIIKKYIVPTINIAYSSAYTSSSAKLSITFTYGNSGDTHLAVFALRGYAEMPAIPDNWECIKWVPPVAGNINVQSLLLLRHIVTDSEQGESATISISVMNNFTYSRHYGIVLNLGDTSIDDSEIITFAQDNIASVTMELYEHTLLMCTSTIATGSAYGNEAWPTGNMGYISKILPNYGDGFQAGGRLAVMYIPYKSHQPFESLKLQATGLNDKACIICCALKLTPGTPYTYSAVLGGS